MKEIIAGNLTRYRQGLGLSQEALAEKVAVTCQTINSQTINNYENAKSLPDSKTLSAIARVLGITLEDLLRPESKGLPNFRFRAYTSFDQKPQFASQVLRMLETYNALEEAVGIPPYAPESTPCDRLEGNEKRIQATAARFRCSLGLGEAPIVNLFTAVEQCGLKVLRQPIAIEGFFGLSACSFAQGAFILVNTHNITIERQLFTLAHEIGHLIFHRDEYEDTLSQPGTKEQEKAREKVANYFAGHLLVPEAELDRFYPFYRDILQLKQHFRVSYQVILTRLSQMGAIDYGEQIKKIRGLYKKQYGKSLKNSMELPPVLNSEDFPENERYQQLILQALNLGKITELKAAELLGTTIESLRLRRQEAEVYAIA